MANYEEMCRHKPQDIGGFSLCFGGRRQYGLDGGNIPRQFDVNEDGEVNFDDIIIVIESWLECTLNPPELCWR